MTIEVRLYLEQEEVNELAHTLTLIAFSHQKDAAFWEGLGDKRLNNRSLRLSSLFSKVGNIFAMVHWSERDKLNYQEQEAKENA